MESITKQESGSATVSIHTEIESICAVTSVSFVIMNWLALNKINISLQ